MDLKRREVKETTTEFKPKGRVKMSAVKPTRLPAKTEDYANPALLVFPTDPLGVTSGLKTACLQSASKIGTDKDNLKLVLGTIDILVKHIEARFKQNVKTPVLARRGEVTDSFEPDVEQPDDQLEFDFTAEDLDALLTYFSGDKYEELEATEEGVVEYKIIKGDRTVARGTYLNLLDRMRSGSR